MSDYVIRPKDKRLGRPHDDSWTVRLANCDEAHAESVRAQLAYERHMELVLECTDDTKGHA